MTQIKCGFVIDDGVYFGELDETQARVGHGRMFYRNGVQYEGEFREDTFNGPGRLLYKSGEYYQGAFAAGCQSGYGEIYNVKRRLVYKGYWKRGKKHGFGEYSYCNGDVYRGGFKDGLKHGFGIKTREGMRLIGVWENNRKEGDFFRLDEMDRKIMKIKYLKGVKMFQSAPDPGFNVKNYNPFLKERILGNLGFREHSPLLSAQNLKEHLSISKLQKNSNSVGENSTQDSKNCRAELNIEELRSQVGF